MYFVGDASMSPYEVMSPGGANEHFNDESGRVWLRELGKIGHQICGLIQYQKNTEIFPLNKFNKRNFENNMVPLSLNGLEEGTKILSKNRYLILRRNLTTAATCFLSFDV